MADITEKIMEDLKQFLLMFSSAAIGQFYSLSSFAVSSITEMFMNREQHSKLLANGGEVTLKQFQKALKRGEKFTSLRVNDYMVDDYKRLMNEKNVLYMSLDDTSNDTKVLVFRDCDLEKMKAVKKLVDVIHLGNSEISADEFLEAHKDKKISVLSNLTRAEVELMRYFAKPSGALFSVVHMADDNYSVLHNADSTIKLREALRKTNLFLNGPYRERLLEQIQYRIQGRQAINIDLDDAKKEFYIVSKSHPNNYVHVSESEVSYYKNGKVLEDSVIYREDPDFKSKTLNLISSISSPTIFDSEEFSQDIGTRQMFVNEKETLDVFPRDMDIAYQEEMQEYNRLRQLVSEKMGLDNENQGNWALYVDSVSFSEYSTYENILDDDAENNFERLKASIYHADNMHQYGEIEVDNTSLDYIINQAKEKQRVYADSRVKAKEVSFNEL